MIEIVLETGKIRPTIGSWDKLCHNGRNHAIEPEGRTTNIIMDLLLSDLKESKIYKIILQVEE